MEEEKLEILSEENSRNFTVVGSRRVVPQMGGGRAREGLFLGVFLRCTLLAMSPSKQVPSVPSLCRNVPFSPT